MATDPNGVLIPVDVSSPVDLNLSALEILAPGRVVILGYWPVPDQATPAQLRDQHEDTAQERVDALADRLADRTFAVTSRLVFTLDRDDSIDRAANEYGAAAILTPGDGIVTGSAAQRVLVLLKPDLNIDRILSVLGHHLSENDLQVTLFHAAEEQAEAMEYMLRGAADQLSDLGVASDRIDWTVETDGSRVNTILSTAPTYDLVVLGETQPSVRERVFGVVQSSLLDQTDRPVMTIRPSDRSADV